jgi:extracellular matrix protein 14
MILDIWSSTPTHIDLRLPKTSTKGFLSLLPTHLKSQHEQIITNLRAAVDYTYPPSAPILPPLPPLRALPRGEDLRVLNELFFSNYQTYETIEQWLHLLEALRPELVTLVVLGKSHEGREILGISLHGNKSTHRVSGDEGTMEKKTLGILAHGAQHAREWISVSTVCFIASQLVTGYYVDDSVRKLVDTFEWRYTPKHSLFALSWDYFFGCTDLEVYFRC